MRVRQQPSSGAEQPISRSEVSRGVVGGPALARHHTTCQAHRVTLERQPPSLGRTQPQENQSEFWFPTSYVIWGLATYGSMGFNCLICKIVSCENKKNRKTYVFMLGAQKALEQQLRR